LDTADFSVEARALKHRLPCIGFAVVEKDRRRMNVTAMKELGIPQNALWGQLQEGKTVTWKNKKIAPEQVTTLIKGKKVTYITDTLPVENCYRLAEDADVLICEAPHTSELKDKAEEYMHLTARDAGQIASRSDVKKLVLQHFSARYANTHEVEEDARVVFDNVIAAKDFMQIQV
ncbi:MAG: ribonuclease Z, partial [Candidatus Woesearchaeota archaeon]|nr:ribonuclease Z [Candidatus Woesearchaeota archaeon]